PQDLNLNIALSDEDGEVVWYDVRGTGLSTCDEALARQHEEHGHEVLERVVRSSTLARVLESRLEQTPLDLLKVDVEGFEARVLAGNDWQRFRPKVIVIEATWPESPVRRETEIPSFLAERGYRRAWFDGLNDFYVEESFDCGDAFASPPNVFDRFVRLSLVEAQQRAERSTEYARSLEQAREQEMLDRTRCVQELQGQITALQAQRAQAEAALEHQRRQIAELSRAEARLAFDAESWRGKADEAGAAQREAVRKLEQLLLLTTRLVGGKPVTTADLVRLGTVQNRGDAEMDQSSGAASAEESLASPSAPEVELRLMTARARRLEDEVSRWQQDVEDLRGENARLRNSAEQMRSEILSLSRSLEPMQVMLEELQALRVLTQKARQDEHGEALRIAEQQRLELERTIRLILSSTSWKLSRPYRLVGAGLKKVLRRPPRR
ncbi:MAG: FkbM family methyltransferase, partial [Acetobacteraceae bacterium]|nr:FkbM family methyltransferase [Acetobacteraceae bacterium]